MLKASTEDPLLDLLAYRLPSKLGRETREQRSRNLLLRALEQGTTIAFLGAGVSVPFGYPRWEKLSDDVLKYTLAKLKEPAEKDKDPRIDACCKHSRFLEDRAKGLGKEPEAAALMFMIGACKSALALTPDGLKDYYELLRKSFKEAKSSGCGNIFKSLLDLPIRRFATTNYDREIENALAKFRKGLVAEKSFDFGLEPDSEEYRGWLSITPRREDLERLILFALARAEGNDNMVFHCHGRFDEPESIVATEADYQKWYLGHDDDASVAFQQNIKLLLASNPLLFIGYGLRDDDLLRPLRELGVLDPAQKGTRPIFALLKCSDENPDKDLLDHEVLFERYGLHVIAYGQDLADKTQALNTALDELREDLQKARRRWSEKPFLKRPEKLSEPTTSYCEIDTKEVKLTDVPAKPLEGLEEEVHHPGIVVLEGPSGVGKSFHALKLTKQEGFDGIYYWNAHYGNEAMTALDHALAYFDPNRNFKGSRYERIRECLRNKRFLLILDGCERLLRRTENPRAGSTYSVTFRRLLKAFANPYNQSTVVLATRLWPIELDFLQHKTGDRQFIRRLCVSRVEAKDLHGIEAFAGLLKRFPDLEGDSKWRQRVELEISALCSLLRGHSYGLHLAGKYLGIGRSLTKASPQEDNELEEIRKELGKAPTDRKDLRDLKDLIDLNRSLAGKHRDERLQEMIQRQVTRADEILRAEAKLADENRHAEPARRLLDVLTNFLGPICEETIAICFKEACIKPDQDCSCVRNKLKDAGILFPMHPPVRETGAAETYTVHCTARTALLRSRHGAPTDPLPAFGLSGCTCGRLGVNPDRTRKSGLRKLFDQIIERAELHWNEGNQETARALCRDAFSLVRTGMEANTAPRWCTYDEYVQFPLAVAILAKRVTSGCWTYCEHAEAFKLAESEDASLYPAELAWLYNDIALALSGSGYIHDACFFLDHALEVSRLIEHPAEGGGFHLEVLLSLAFTLIEMGYLPAACRHLDDAERLVREMSDDDFAARILGLRGLMLHLKGDLQGADDLYDRCLKLLRPGMNLRAQSIFLKHKADVKISSQAFEEADLLVRNSRALAESGVFPELVANARISEGHRLTRTGQAVQARLEYTAVLHEAQRIGFRKLEVRALTALARLALDQKDADGGRDYAMRALTLANQLGLGLRQSHALVVLGLATLEMGQTGLGIAYLRSAKQLADDQEYWSRSREAENKLLELGVSPASEDEAGGDGALAARRTR